jgi:hypothetical protein
MLFGCVGCRRQPFVSRRYAAAERTRRPMLLGFPSRAPFAFLAASAARILSEIRRRSFSQGPRRVQHERVGVSNLHTVYMAGEARRTLHGRRASGRADRKELGNLRSNMKRLGDEPSGLVTDIQRAVALLVGCGLNNQRGRGVRPYAVPVRPFYAAVSLRG